MQRINVVTYFDCTQTNTTSYRKIKNSNTFTTAKEWDYSRNQQRNFETVTQIIGLRAQPINLEIPHNVKVDLAEHKFGTDFTGVQAVWSFTFTVEHTAVFDRDNTSLRALVLDMDNIPCIIKMTETVTIVSPVFRSQGTSSNIYFEKII